jgi:hypothetical protein
MLTSFAFVLTSILICVHFSIFMLTSISFISILMLTKKLINYCANYFFVFLNSIICCCIAVSSASALKIRLPIIKKTAKSTHNQKPIQLRKRNHRIGVATNIYTTLAPFDLFSLISSMAMCSAKR